MTIQLSLRNTMTIQLSFENSCLGNHLDFGLPCKRHEVLFPTGGFLRSSRILHMRMEHRTQEAFIRTPSLDTFMWQCMWEPWHIHMRGMTHAYGTRDSLIWQTWRVDTPGAFTRIHSCGDSCGRHYTFICATWLVHLGHMTHSYGGHDHDASVYMHVVAVRYSMLQCVAVSHSLKHWWIRTRRQLIGTITLRTFRQS